MSPVILPVVLALGAAILFAFGNQFSRLALRHMDSQSATLIQIGTATALYWVLSPFYLKIEYWLAPILPMLILVGLIRPFISANLSMAGTRILGPTISSTLSATSPLFSIVLGVVLLAETLSWEIGIGTFGIVMGIVVLSWRRGQTLSWPLLAILFPIGAAFIRSLSHTISKYGLETVPSPFFVALVAYSVSLLVALANAARIGRRREWSLQQGGVKWSAIAGLMYGIAVIFLNSALLSGQLIVVSPLVSCSPVITLLLGYFVFNEDAITRRVIVAVLIVAPSVALIAASRG